MAAILAIEDDWTVKTVLEHTLTSAGHDVDVHLASPTHANSWRTAITRWSCWT